MRENKWTVKTRREKVSKRQPGKQFTVTITGSIISGSDATRWALGPKQDHGGLTTQASTYTAFHS